MAIENLKCCLFGIVIGIDKANYSGCLIILTNANNLIEDDFRDERDISTDDPSFFPYYIIMTGRIFTE
jgi:hypothetical protein